MNVARPKRAEWIALILAVGIATALNLITLAILYTAIMKKSDVNGGISENATQILTGWGGGMIGVIGAYVGYKAAQVEREELVVNETTQEPGEEQVPLEEPGSPQEDPGSQPETEAPAEEEEKDEPLEGK